MRPMFGPLVPSLGVTFVSQVSIDNGTIEKYGLRKTVSAVKNCRNIGKKDMKYNDAMPKVKVDPEMYRVEADGVHITAEPAETLPLSQGFYVF